MATRYLLGIDIGTYSSKGVLVDENGQVIASRVVAHTLELPHPGWAEHDAETTWWQDFLKITRHLLQESGVPPHHIAGIGLSAISSAVLPIDHLGNPLRRAILYGIDTRAVREIAELQEVIDKEPELAKSGVRLSSQSAAPKVLWIRHNEPDVWARTFSVVNGSGFLLYRLTGQNTIDIYNASTYAPFVDYEREQWNPNVGEYFAPQGRLPHLTWTCDIAGRVTREGAARSGLAEGTPIITGTADAAAEAISAGLANVGDMMIMYGSSVFFILRTSELCRAPHFWGAHFLERGTHVLTGAVSTAGSLTTWFRDEFAPLETQAERAGGENAYSALAQLASKSSVGAKGLVMLPYFSGERIPILDPNATGLVFGLRLDHTRGDVYRALLESIGFGIRHNLEQMIEEGAEPQRILGVGGGTLNPLLMQIVSNIANIQQFIPSQQIGASYGDAFLAGVGVGLFSRTSEASRWVTLDRVITPQLDLHQEYQEYYHLYRELYTRNAPLMQRLTRFVQRM